MASQLPTSIGSASALPLATALSVIPSLPHPLLSRRVERAIERLERSTRLLRIWRTAIPPRTNMTGKEFGSDSALELPPERLWNNQTWIEV